MTEKELKELGQIFDESNIKDKIKEIDNIIQKDETILKNMSELQHIIKSINDDTTIKDLFKMIDKKINTIQPEKLNVSIQEILERIDNLVIPEMKANGDYYDTILCITRGGLVPAGIMAYKLGIKNIINISISSYDSKDKQGECEVRPLSKKDIKKLNKSNGLLIIDDIIDTGKTINNLADYLVTCVDIDILEESKIFAVVDKINLSNTYSCFDMKNDPRWVVFEWDK